MLPAEITRPVIEEFAQTKTAIESLDVSQVPLVNEVAQHLLGKGGKRLRPLVLLLAAKACDYHETNHIQIATAIEYIHGATLLHDDVVDNSDKRHAQETAHTRWNNTTSILVGDFLYSKSFQIIVEHCDKEILHEFAATTNAMAEGEVDQLTNRYNLALSEKDYLAVLANKTGKLFALSALTAGLLAEKSPDCVAALRNYGMNLGIAFQLADDLLDLTADNTNFGKNLGDDLAQGNFTLPLLYAFQHAEAATQQQLHNALVCGTLSTSHLAEINQLIDETGALKYCQHLASTFVDNALTALHVLPDSACKTALQQLAYFAIKRGY